MQIRELFSPSDGRSRCTETTWWKTTWRKKQVESACLEQHLSQVYGHYRCLRIRQINKLPCSIIHTFRLVLNTNLWSTAIPCASEWLIFFFLLNNLDYLSVSVHAGACAWKQDRCSAQQFLEGELNAISLSEGADFWAGSGQIPGKTMATAAGLMPFCLCVK